MQNLKKINIEKIKTGELFKYLTDYTKFIAKKTSGKAAFGNKRIQFTITKNIQGSTTFREGANLNFYDDGCFYEIPKPKPIETFKGKNKTKITCHLRKTR